MICRSLSVITVFGMSNRHTILRHTKFCTFFGRDGCEWLDLDPFCEVVDSNKEELCLPISR